MQSHAKRGYLNTQRENGIWGKVNEGLKIINEKLRKFSRWKIKKWIATKIKHWKISYNWQTSTRLKHSSLVTFPGLKHV